MMQLHSVLPDLAQRELRWLQLEPKPGVPPRSSLPAGKYAFVEFFCEDLMCDCRRAFLHVIPLDRPDQILASINCGWEKEAFYRSTITWDEEAPKQVVEGSLDPINRQSEHAKGLLDLFQRHVWNETFRQRLKQHYELFREEISALT